MMPGGRRVKVAQVVAAVNGAVWVADICEGLQERGYDVVAIVNRPEGSLAADLRRRGIPYVCVPQNLRFNSRWAGLLSRLPVVGRVAAGMFELALLAGQIVRLAAVLRRLGVDVVQTHVFPTQLVPRVAAWLAGVPVRVAMIAGPYHLDVPFFWRLDRATYRLDHHILAGSRTVEERYERMGVASSRRSFTYYGPTAEQFDPRRARHGRLRRELGLGPDVPLVGQIAHFYPPADGSWAPEAVRGKDVKGHDLVLRAAALVRRRHPEAHFVLVGAPWGELGERLIEETLELASQLGLDDALTVTGMRTDIPDVLADLDVSIQASRSENLGGTIEALLMEAPTIATAVGGMPEAVVDEETGLLVPPEDPEALADAVCRLLQDPAWARSLAVAGRRRMLAGYTSDRMVGDIDDVIRSLARRRGVSGAPVEETAT